MGGTDDREPEHKWAEVVGAVDIVMYEGWKVGVEHWRYARFNAAIDCLMYLDADIETVREWKKESSQRDARREEQHWDEATAMENWNTWIEPFFKRYELPLKSKADLVVSKSASHRIRKCG